MAEQTRDVRNNMRRKMLVIGKTGTGKSTLCNRIAGLAHDDTLFPVSAAAMSCTQGTKFGNVKFGGNTERLVSLIDTIGFDDPDNDTDTKIIAELVDKLINNCDKIHLFVIAVNGQSPRMDGSLVAMLKIFKEMFGEEFWGQCCIVFTRVPMHQMLINLRQKHGDGKTDQQRAAEYMQVVESKFDSAKGRDIKYMYLDACYDEDDDDSREAFDNSMEELYNLLEAFEGLETPTINQQVETDHAKIKRELKARDEEKVKMAKDLQTINDKLKEAESKRHEDEGAYQRGKKEAEEKMKELDKRGQRRGGDFFGDVARGMVGSVPFVGSVFRMLEKRGAVQGQKLLGNGVVGGGTKTAAIGDMAKSAVPVIGEVAKSAVPVIGDVVKSGNAVIGEVAKSAVPVMGEVAKSGNALVGEVVKSAVPVIGKVTCELVKSAVPVMGPVMVAMAKSALK